MEVQLTHRDWTRGLPGGDGVAAHTKLKGGWMFIEFVMRLVRFQKVPVQIANEILDGSGAETW